jgi:hypothetical protein
LFSARFENCVCHLSLPGLRAGNLPSVPPIGKLFFKNEKAAPKCRFFLPGIDVSKK